MATRNDDVWKDFGEFVSKNKGKSLEELRGLKKEHPGWGGDVNAMRKQHGIAKGAQFGVGSSMKGKVGRFNLK